MNNTEIKKRYEKPCIHKIECGMVLPFSSSVNIETEGKDDIILNARPMENIWDSHWPSAEENVY